MMDFSFRDALTRFTRDLTAAAMRGEFDPICCRENEIRRVLTILIRQSKNNPVLVGEAGVGKTAVVEGLAQQIAWGQVPERMKTARILSLSHVDLIAGTQFRGQYEKRLQAVIQMVSADPDIILFVDEMHNLIGAGAALGAPMDAANMLKPALANGQMRVIGATTEFEYERYIRSDSALERRFQPVRIEELGNLETLQILRARRQNLEMHHLLAIPDEALEAAVDSSHFYLPDRRQPDRSIDLLDEACAHMQLELKETPESVSKLRLERDRLIAAERQAVEEILAMSIAEGTPIERFSRGTYKLLENVGIGLEKLLTGQSSSRPPLPVPDSVRKIRARDPEKRLSQIHAKRLQAQDALKRALLTNRLVISADDIRRHAHTSGSSRSSSESSSAQRS